MNAAFDLEEQAEAFERDAYSLVQSEPLAWALGVHKNIRGESMRFWENGGTEYLWDLYRIIDDTPLMVVEKSVQCFPAGTKVVTPFGYVPIEEIEVGDMVLTHTGSYSPVTNTFKRHVDEDLIERRADLMPVIRSTAEHPFYSYRYAREKYRFTRRERVFGNGAEWVSAGDLKDGDFIARAKIPPSTGDLEDVSVVEAFDRPIVEWDGDWFREKWGQRFTACRVKLDYGFGQLVGLYLSKGWVDRGMSGQPQKLCFGFHRDEEHLESVVRREIDRLYRGPIRTYVGGGNTCRRVFVSSYHLSEVFGNWFGEGCDQKRIPPMWLSDAPARFLRGILDGALLGDGSRGSGAQLQCVSETFVNQIRFIAAMHGVYGVIREEHPEGSRAVYSFVYSDTRNCKYSRIQDIDDNHVALRVKKTKRVPFKGTVHNLEVAGDNSYVAEDYVVHNCGLSELFIIMSHIEAGKRGLSVMYVLPKYELRNRFVNNRIYKLHKRVRTYSEMVIEAETKVHRTSLMHFGKGTLAYVGSNVESEFIEIPVDSAYVDEKDRCNLNHLEMLPDRLTASPYQHQREISNPTIEGYGIDERYHESSMGLWKIKCPHCGQWFTPDFFRHVVEERSHNVFVPRDPLADADPQASGEIALIHDCGKPVNRLMRGEWVHAYPNRDWQGFRVSKLFARLSPKGTMRSLYRSWVKAVGNDLKTQIFFNSDLGLPFSSKGARISRAMLNDCRRRYEYPPRHVSRSNGRFMGVDVGETLHVILRERVRSENGSSMRLIGAWAVPGFSAVAQLIREWKPDRVVIDSLPEIHKVMELKADFSRVFSSRFQESTNVLSVNKQKREVSMNRTAILDYVRQGVEMQTLLLPMEAEFIEDGEYYAHMMASTRILEPNETNPEKSRFVWKEGSRPDHFFLAEAYCMQASMLVPNHDIFEFFAEQANTEPEHAAKRKAVHSDLTSEERAAIGKKMDLTPAAALVEIREMNKPKKVKPPVDDERIQDTVELLAQQQGYVDVDIAAQMSEEHEDDVIRILRTLGFKQSKIKRQYVK